MVEFLRHAGKRFSSPDLLPIAKRRKKHPSSTSINLSLRGPTTPTDLTLPSNSEDDVLQRQKKFDVLKTQSHSKVTPWVYSLAKQFYPNNLELIAAGSDSKTETDRVILNNDSIWQHDGLRGFQSATIDNTTYFPGDFILVQSGDNGSRNSLYARIIYLYRDIHGESMGHFRMFEHGASTCLGEFADRYELFLLDECRTFSLATIIKKLQVTQYANYIGTIAQEAYYYRLRYSKTTQKYSHISDYKEVCNGERHCIQCTLATQAEHNNAVQILGAVTTKRSKTSFEGVRVRGVAYYVNDYVFVFSEAKKPFIIGQLTKLYTTTPIFLKEQEGWRIQEKDIRIKFSTFERYDNLIPGWFKEKQDKSKHMLRDERRIYSTKRIEKGRTNSLEGRCVVRYADDFKNEEEKNLFKDQNDTHFWVSDKLKNRFTNQKPVRMEYLRKIGKGKCINSQKQEDLESQASLMDSFQTSGKKLRGLDVFGGGGSLTEGLQNSGVVEMNHMVDFAMAACKTAKRNHPKITCHNADASVLLERALRIKNGELLNKIFDVEGNEVPDLPKPGEIDFICGGPPCPGYSKANRIRKNDDILNTLTAVYLSYLDFYRPKYFLLENVGELLKHRLGATQINENRTKGGIEEGTVKLILRAITGLGYQVEFAMLQAAEYGTPSYRSRVFFWASLPGNPLPSFPQPRNVVKNPRNYAPGDCLAAQWWRKSRSAAHWEINTGSAILDLPTFEYTSSHLSCPRREMQIKQGSSQYFGTDCSFHEKRPLSEYQRRARKGVPKLGSLLNHITLRLYPGSRDVICNIPQRPGANLQDLTDVSLRAGLRRKSKPASKKFESCKQRFRRVDPEKVYNTLMASSFTPNSKYGNVLHPWQNRVLTIRERCRLMGFSDSYSFDFKKIKISEATRILGNAVPPTLAKALGDELLKILIQKDANDEDDSMEVS